MARLRSEQMLRPAVVMKGQPTFRSVVIAIFRLSEIEGLQTTFCIEGRIGFAPAL